MTAADALSVIQGRDRDLLLRLMQEQRQLTTEREKRFPSKFTAHRPVPVSLSWDQERNGEPGWRCAHCGATARFPDLFDDFDCSSIPLPFEDSL